MDGEHSLGVGQAGGDAVGFQQVDGHQRGLPVVAVDHIGDPVHLAGDLYNGAGEVGKALAVVKVAVDIAALEIILVVHKPVGHAVLLQFEHTAIGLAPGQGDDEILPEGHLLPPLGADFFVQGQNDMYIMTHTGQRAGQASGHIGQTAGFDKGSNLRGCKQDFHIVTSLAHGVG